MGIAGWIAGATWGGMAALAAGALTEPDAMAIRIPHGRSAVWVPLDPAGAPRGLSQPPVPVRGARVYLDVHPDTASVEVDGYDVGVAHQFVTVPLSLDPGLRHVDIVYPGFKPVRLVVDVSGEQTYLLRALLEPDGSAIEPDSGYLVVPRP
jgi:PEGA domain